MNKIIPPLKPDMQGATVADLQGALKLLLDRGVMLRDDEGARRELSTALEREHSVQTYGGATRKLVGIFQETHHLEVRGEVDERTAAALNAALEDLGAFETPPEARERVVTGQVRLDDGTPVGGVSVRAINQADREAVLLGDSRTDDSGHYNIRYDVPTSGRLRLRVEANDPNGRQLAASDVIVDPRLAETVDLVVPRSDRRKYVVAGTITSRDRLGIGGLRVVVVDKNVGGDATVAETRTDDEGVYRAAFDASAFGRRGKQHPDLQARVLAGDGAVLGRSAIQYNASTNATLDVVLDETAAGALPAEFDVLTGVLSSQFDGRLADLKEDDQQQDITYLANKTGWDARAVAMASLADQFSAGTADATGARSVAQPLFYALFRAGLPANETALFQTDIKTVRSVWTAAMAQGVISPASGANMEQALSRFQEMGVSSALKSPAVVGPSSWKEMLSASRLSDDQQATFTRLYTAHESDPDALWNAVSEALGRDVAARLQVDGKLGLLTVNNAPLMTKLHSTAFAAGATDTLQLAQGGYHRPAAWSALLTADVPVPREIPGDTDAAKRDNYAAFLAAQVRLTYPTASVAHMVKSGDVVLPNAPAGASDDVHGFLTEHQGRFEIGVQPVEQYIARNKVEATDATVQQIKRLQRAYQLTASDQAFAGLMRRGVDSAYEVVRYEKEAFVGAFAEDLGGADQAAATFDKAAQVHNAVLNIALSYLHARTAPAIGVHSPPNSIDPTPAHADDVIAYASLEKLFGGMDFCACEHCRSILSPAAYLVDLLHYLDLPSLPAGLNNPLSVLLDRRPDIQHLPLTCENTNTALPYIDIVNETLEYFIANDSQKLSLKDYEGHDTQDAASADLMASPQFAMDSAYAILQAQRFPAPLPFNRSLEQLRRHFTKLDVPLSLAMERLRRTDDIERGTQRYAWRDILIEALGLSREEHETLTDSKNVPLWRLYGFADGTADSAAIAELANAKRFVRRVGLTYEELIALLQTRFINPNGSVIPRLERLGIPFTALAALKDGTLADGDFLKAVNQQAPAPDPAQYGGDIKTWVVDDANYARIMGLVVLSVPAAAWTASHAFTAGDLVVPKSPGAPSTLYFECTTSGTSGAAEPSWITTPGMTCSDGTVVWTCRDASDCRAIEHLAFRYSDPAKAMQDIGTAELVRIARFIRLWKKLGWSIAQTDAALCAYFRGDFARPTPADLDDVAKLDQGFLTALPRIGISQRLMSALNLSVRADLLALLANSADIGTHGADSLYGKLFLNPSILKQDPVFADNGYGDYLTDATQRILNSKSVQKAGVSGTITVGNELVTMINGVEVRYMAVASDATLSDLAASLAGAVNAATDKEPRSGRKLNEVVQASALGNVLSVKSLDVEDEFTLTCWAAPGSTVLYATRDHEAALRAALNLTNDEFALIVNALGFTEATPLDLPNVSAVFRRAWLARKLSLSVREFLLLIQRSGIKPFGIDEVANPGIFRLLRLVQAIRESSLSVSAALYLIWNDDISGRSSPTDAAVDELARTLRGDFAQVDAQLSTPAEPDADIARENVALVYGNDAADAFFGLLDETLVIDVPYTHAIPDLDASILAADPQLKYDAFRHRLSHTGLVAAPQQAALKAVAGVTQDFKDAIDELFARGEAAIGLFFTQHPEFKSAYDLAIVKPKSERHGAFVTAFRPQLVSRRKRQQALQRLASAAGVDSVLCRCILDSEGTQKALQADGRPDLSALDDALALEVGGLEASFYFRDAPTGNVDKKVPAADTLDYSPGRNPLPDPGVLSGVWRGRVEAPETGLYNIIVTAGAGSSVNLVLRGKVLSLVLAGSTWRNKEAISLSSGTLYTLEVSVANVKDVVRIEWETPTRKREVIPAQYLYPPSIRNAFSRTYVRLLKAASLSTTLHLTSDELLHFATVDEFHVDGAGWLNALPAIGSAPAATAIALLKPLEGLLAYASIKRELTGVDNSLLAVLKDPDAALTAQDSLLCRMTGWSFQSVLDLLDQFAIDVSQMGHLDVFRRVYDAMALVKKMGVSARALLRATTNDPAADSVRELQAGVRARYDASAWRDVIRPISDELRGLQRDALVAYILHMMRSNPASAHIDAADKLFEYFLMDVGMEPCMETSRIRHALSSVQLFIERCLMNLEANVSPDAFSAPKRKAWNWMKRYRVWEANRKVYLFPENWLEPELRDDKSPFFKEIESELLQGDITEERAATALLNYLGRLEEVAKLEQCAIHYVPRDEAQNILETSHVVARTSGANRKYFYRRCESGSWSPWEPIKLDIDDNPVTLVVWKDRLLLFWVRIIQEKTTTASAPTGATQAEGEKLTNISLGDIKAAASVSLITAPPQVNVRIIICFSEYRDGKWQATKTSSVERAPLLGTYPVGQFDRASLWLAIGDVFSHLRVEVQEGFTLGGKTCFYVYNTHSAPVGKDEDPILPSWPFFGFRYFGAPPLTINYIDVASNKTLTRQLLGRAWASPRVTAPRHLLLDSWTPPFFYEDRQHVFHVTTKQEPIWISEYKKFGATHWQKLENVGQSAIKIPPLYIAVDTTFVKPRPLEDPLGVDLGVQVASGGPASTLEATRLRRTIPIKDAVTFGKVQVGPSGAMPGLNKVVQR